MWYDWYIDLNQPLYVTCGRKKTSLLNSVLLEYTHTFVNVINLVPPVSRVTHSHICGIPLKQPEMGGRDE